MTPDGNITTIGSIMVPPIGATGLSVRSNKQHYRPLAATLVVRSIQLLANSNFPIHLALLLIKHFSGTLRFVSHVCQKLCQICQVSKSVESASSNCSLTMLSGHTLSAILSHSRSGSLSWRLPKHVRRVSSMPWYETNIYRKSTLHCSSYVIL